MTDKEFEDLKDAIEHQVIELQKLQRAYRAQTGRDYVMPLRYTCGVCSGTGRWFDTDDGKHGIMKKCPECL